jgi:starvation-inducible DNA-binding protein
MSITQSLSEILASQYTLYLKVQNFHWNIEDRGFFSVHLFTEKLYEELADQIDDTAERIRMLGEKAPGSFTEYSKMTDIQEAKGQTKSDEIIKELIQDYETMVKKYKSVIEMADESGDVGTSDLLTPYVSSYEKHLWMMKSYL